MSAAHVPEKGSFKTSRHSPGLQVAEAHGQAEVGQGRGGGHQGEVIDAAGGRAGAGAQQASPARDAQRYPLPSKLPPWQVSRCWAGDTSMALWGENSLAVCNGQKPVTNNDEQAVKKQTLWHAQVVVGGAGLGFWFKQRSGGVPPHTPAPPPGKLFFG